MYCLLAWYAQKDNKMCLMFCVWTKCSEYQDENWKFVIPKTQNVFVYPKHRLYPILGKGPTQSGVLIGFVYIKITVILYTFLKLSNLVCGQLLPSIIIIFKLISMWMERERERGECACGLADWGFHFIFFFSSLCLSVCRHCMYIPIYVFLHEI